MDLFERYLHLDYAQRFMIIVACRFNTRQIRTAGMSSRGYMEILLKAGRTRIGQLAGQLSQDDMAHYYELYIRAEEILRNAMPHSAQVHRLEQVRTESCSAPAVIYP